MSYTPNANEVGEDTFTYEVTDNVGTMSSAQVTVFINDVPVANDDASGAELPAEIATGVATDLDVQANDTGLNDTPITVTVTSAPPNGATTIVGGQVRYTSDPGFVGQDTFEYTLTDSRGVPNPDVSAAATVTVNVDDAPVANDDGTMGAPAFMVPEGTAMDLDVLANDTGLSDTPLTVAITAQGTLGATAPSGSPGDASTIRDRPIRPATRSASIHSSTRSRT